MRQPDRAICSFHGEHRWLSNFWPAAVSLDGREYPTVEHAYQAAKFPFLSSTRTAIAVTVSPGQAKRIANGFPNRTLQRTDWADVKLYVMEGLLHQKFVAHAELRQKLLDTGSAQLVEGNTWGDTFWGVCRGTGSNHLGKLLMFVRHELRARQQET